jgi:hypothetical protein
MGSFARYWEAHVPTYGHVLDQPPAGQRPKEAPKLEARQNLRRVPFQPIVIAMSILFALVLGLFAGYAVATINAAPPPHAASSTATVTEQGPDAQERNAELSMQQLSKDTTHGH